MSFPSTALAQGKRLLMEAALNLTANSRSLSALSLRELAREAGLNPNTFYRHFKNLDDMGMAIIEEMSGQIRQPLRDLRRRAAESVIPPGSPPTSWEENAPINFVRSVQVNKETVKLFFDYVESNPNAFIMGVRELHGASPTLRKALRKLMVSFAEDMADDIEMLNLLPVLERAPVFEMAETISREMFLLSMDYIEQPGNRELIAQKAENMIMTLSMGYVTLHGHGELMAGALKQLTVQIKENTTYVFGGKP